MRKKQISFKNKVLIPVVSIFLVSVLAISFINYRFFYTSVKTKTDANLELFIDSVMSQLHHLNTILDVTKQILNEKHIALGRTIVYILDNTQHNITPAQLQELAESMDMVELSIADHNGIITHSNIPEYIGFDYNSTETTRIYMALADGSLTELSEDPRISVLNGEIYGGINHYTGIARQRGGGFIQIGFNAEVVARLQEEINIERTIKEANILRDEFSMVISDGNIIAHPDDNMSGVNIENEEWFNAINSGRGFAWINIDDQKYYAAFNNSDGYTVAALVTEDNYFKELNVVMVQTFFFTLFSMCVIIILVHDILGRLLQPINHLVHGLELIAAGNLDIRIEGNFNDEFDKIKDAVNSMAEETKAREIIISGIEYASKIQRNILPQDNVCKEAFADYYCIWKPKDIVGGDIYWIKNFNAGTVLCVCDCTGHGTSGALLTMLVVSVFDTLITEENCFDTAGIIWELEKRLVSELNVDRSCEKNFTINYGCDLAVLFISKEGTVMVSAGNINVFFCDGKAVTRIKGQRLRVGDGKIQGKEDIKVTMIPFNPVNKFYIPSDGLYEQVGGPEQIPFGYDKLNDIILKHHGEEQSIIAQKIWQAFEEYRGDNAMRDDFELIAFTPRYRD